MMINLFDNLICISVELCTRDRICLSFINVCQIYSHQLPLRNVPVPSLNHRCFRRAVVNDHLGRVYFFALRAIFGRICNENVRGAHAYVTYTCDGLSENLETISSDLSRNERGSVKRTFELNQIDQPKHFRAHLLERSHKGSNENFYHLQTYSDSLNDASALSFPLCSRQTRKGKFSITDLT